MPLAFAYLLLNVFLLQQKVMKLMTQCNEQSFELEVSVVQFF